MSPVWVIPVVVALLGGLVLGLLIRTAGDSVRELAAEVARFGELQASLRRVGGELAAGAGTVRDLRGR